MKTMSNEPEPDLSGDESSVSTTRSVKSTPASSPKKSRKHCSEKKKKNAQKSAAAGLSAAEQELYNTHADAIRANAKQLLNTEISPSTNRYRSYHDSPATFISSDSTSLPPWTSSSNAQSSYGVGDVLSISQVASMAFNCIAHCVTEGYRAVANYYSTYEQGGKFDHNYEQVGRREDVDSASSSVGGYQNSSGYQNQQMERGPLFVSSENQSSGRDTEQSNFQVKGEYAHVPMPSTYQGGIHVLK